VVWRPTELELDDSPSYSVSWDGITADLLAGESLAVGDVCYLKSDGKMWKADADAETTANTMLGMVTKAASADEEVTFLLLGFIRNDSWNWSTVGALLYVHTTGGSPTATRPSGSGDIVRVVGYVINADVIYFNPDRTFIELA